MSDEHNTALPFSAYHLGEAIYELAGAVERGF